jgi:hypothetical protein
VPEAPAFLGEAPGCEHDHGVHREPVEVPVQIRQLREALVDVRSNEAHDLDGHGQARGLAEQVDVFTVCPRGEN